MAKIGPFFKLNGAHLNALRDGEGLDTQVLEREMIQNNGGIDLSAQFTSSIPGMGEETFRFFVPHFKREYDNRNVREREMSKTLRKYSQISGPCSMKVDSTDELLEHMLVGYEVAHFHYILGKKHNMRGMFPRYCCGTSSRSVALSLMDFNYPNAAYAYSHRYDHGYVILPFVMANESIKGSIVVDPTYDQLWNSDKGRNAVFVKLGSEWEYKTDWKKGANLFPDDISSMDIFREAGSIVDWDEGYRDVRKYFARAFANPVYAGAKRSQ